LNLAPRNPIYPRVPQIAYEIKTNKYPINMSLPFFSGFLLARIIGSETVCKKYPAQNIPHKGAKLALIRTRVLVLASQSVRLDSAEFPTTKDVSPRAIKPIAMTKTISMMMKTTPNEPMRMKIARSFLLHTMTRKTKRKSAV